ncbi:hypothetical protein IQ259_11765 [Fortiea sp. LEGE XX443]|uniref:hypothetical protein n=1 Tax=Fortiea sp. LEGE XX443 TaxID=1828611 RepID=UPI00187F445D|nr:hypothetical protein [Fortiea sp. LEGE XX443]MBE9005703.1 hypothetical protein [Fortiea sp. LEGE XX443]
MTGDKGMVEGRGFSGRFAVERGLTKEKEKLFIMACKFWQLSVDKYVCHLSLTERTKYER